MAEALDTESDLPVVGAVPSLFDDPEVREPYLKHYETVRGRVRTAIVQRHLQAVLSEMNAESLRVLDVGCGDGRDSAWLAGLGHDVVAFDPSSEMIERARSQHCADGLAGSASLEFRLGDHEQALAEFGPHSFDLVLTPRAG